MKPDGEKTDHSSGGDLSAGWAGMTNYSGDVTNLLGPIFTIVGFAVASCSWRPGPGFVQSFSCHSFRGDLSPLTLSLNPRFYLINFDLSGTEESKLYLALR